MKHLRETFTDQEFEALTRAKDESTFVNWHDFILSLAEAYTFDGSFLKMKRKKR
jgi:hypothetical protein